MKRSELKIGEAYYYDRSTNWADVDYSSGCKAVVVDTKRYAIVESRWVHSQISYREDPKGTAVLVDIYHGGTSEPLRRAVSTAHLRGPWETTRAEVEAARNARLEREEATRASEDDLRRRANAAVERASSMEVNASVRDEYCGEAKILMSVPEFERLLDLAGDPAITNPE